MGGGRSGSTLLDLMLGNHASIESVGELCNVSQHGWTDSRRCACGRPAPECSYWSDIRRRWAQSVENNNEAEYGRLVTQLESQRMRLQPLARRAEFNDAQVQDYLRRTAGLYRAVLAVSGKRILVDSSKRRSRALLLATTPEIDLRIIHLVRDVRGVAWSERKSFKNAPDCQDTKGRPVWQTALQWNLHNLQSDWVRRQLHPARSIRIRYEDLVTQPQKTLDEIGRLIDLDMSQLAETLARGGQMQAGHLIGGNRMRMAGSVRLRADTEWFEKLSTRERWICGLLSGRMMGRYGYSHTPDTAVSPVCLDDSISQQSRKAA